MSEAHDKIIADKEFKIADLDRRIAYGQEALSKLKAAFTKYASTNENEARTFEVSVDLLKVSNELFAHIEMIADGVRRVSGDLLRMMRETTAAFRFEAIQMKGAADGAKDMRSAASDLKAAVEIINSIRPTIRELMQNPEELNVIRSIINACAPTIHRERSNAEAGEQTSPAPDVQVG